jgi:1-acyl-sn-glycerol-3-phosphate acyltransferase
MNQLRYTNGAYRTKPGTVSPFSRIFPTFFFYIKFLTVVFKASWKAKRRRYSDEQWCESSLNIVRALENIGVEIEITGIEHLRRLNTPCVIIANHMSVLETMALPIIIHPICPMTFIVKQSLLEYPVFKHVIRSRNMISVGRTNPRLDYKVVLEEGKDRLKKGISVVVFPQRTRARSIEPSQFNSIGVKLAKSAGVPVVPLALLTDAWKNGRLIKEFGSIDPSQKVYFSFGAPIWVKGRGNEEHKTTIDFICEKLS